MYTSMIHAVRFTPSGELYESLSVDISAPQITPTSPTKAELQFFERAVPVEICESQMVRGVGGGD